MADLFESTSVNTLELKNRFVRSATWEGLAGDDGSVTPRLVGMMADLAGGGVGLIISSHAYVSREGQAGPWQLGAHSDALIPGLARMAEAVHASGGRIVLQLAHAGAFGAMGRTGLRPMGPSGFEPGSGPPAREMTLDDIVRVTEAFALAAGRAQQAGFDGVQIHGAHGYLISQFLSPFFNSRQDEYGGTTVNRARFAQEVLLAIRRTTGPRFPVMVKLNSEDFLPGGLSVDDMIRTSAGLEEAGIDAIEMSGGTLLSGPYYPSRTMKGSPGEPEAFYEGAARKYKEAVKTPLMLVGGIRSLEAAERLVAEEVADYISLARPLIREPGLINRWKSGDRRPAFCISDSGCFRPALQGKGVSCVVEAREGKTTAG